MRALLNRRQFLITPALMGVTLKFARADEPPAFGPLDAAEIKEADYLYLRRPVIVFADSAQNPNFIRQMELLAPYMAELERRDVILITDTAPEAPSDLRRRLRPRGFALILMDKDWGSATRKPLPWDGREIINHIAKFPTSRQEALERNPSGR